MLWGCWVLLCDLSIKVQLSTPSAIELFIDSAAVCNWGMTQQGQELFDFHS